jgi:hypothetical protein
MLGTLSAEMSGVALRAPGGKAAFKGLGRDAVSGRFRLIFMLLIIPSSLALGLEGT